MEDMAAPCGAAMDTRGSDTPCPRRVVTSAPRERVSIVESRTTALLAALQLSIQ
jgi:hypothetical protein